MAKDAVLICMPNNMITHCPASLPVPGNPPGVCDESLEQGVVRSEYSTPFSRASCSNVIGMNDPERYD